MLSMPGKTVGFKGWGAIAYGGVFQMTTCGITNDSTGIPVDHNWHSVTITRTAGVGTKMRIDGGAWTVVQGAGTVGTAIVMAADYNAAFSNFIKGGVKKITMVNAALTDAQCALMEAYALSTP